MSPSNKVVLVIDIGGTHVKLLATGQKEPIKIPSGPEMTPRRMATLVRTATAKWKYSAVSIGYPGPVLHGKPVSDPHNLAPGWVGFDFRKALGRPVKLMNDAALQAIGSYKRGRMLFLGLGTGLGSALIVDGVIEPMELAHLPYKKGGPMKIILGCVASRDSERENGGVMWLMLSIGLRPHWRSMMSSLAEGT